MYYLNIFLNMQQNILFHLSQSPTSHSIDAPYTVAVKRWSLNGIWCFFSINFSLTGIKNGCGQFAGKHFKLLSLIQLVPSVYYTFKEMFRAHSMQGFAGILVHREGCGLNHRTFWAHCRVSNDAVIFHCAHGTGYCAACFCTPNPDRTGYGYD